jgi:hypothetical protein
MLTTEDPEVFEPAMKTLCRDAGWTGVRQNVKRGAPGKNVLRDLWMQRASAAGAA